MLLRRTSLFAVAVLLINASVHAYDTQGKFGMGINLMGTPVLLFSTMKIGVTNSFGLEPSVGFHQFSVTETYPDQVYQNGDYVETDVTKKSKYNLLMLSGMCDFKPVQRERSNFLVRGGVSFWRAWEAESRDPEDTLLVYDNYAFWNVSAKAGFGVEHFFTDNFSVYAGVVSQFTIFGSNVNDDTDYDSFVYFTSVGNQVAELSFVWYL